MADEENVSDSPENDSDNQEQNEESNEDTTENSDDQSNSESGEPSGDDSSEEKVEEFTDLASLPAPMKEIGKRMQASYTKKVQAMKNEMRQLEENLGTTYSQHIIKARALDELGKNPQFQLFMADVIENDRPYGYSSNIRNGRDNESEDEPRNNGNKKVEDSDIEARIERAISRALKPIRDKATMDTYNDVSKRPFFDKNKPLITQLVQENGMSLDRAYMLASAEDRAKAEFQSKKDREDVANLKKKPRTEKSSGGGKTPTLSSTTKKTLRESILSAVDSTG